MAHGGGSSLVLIGCLSLLDRVLVETHSSFSMRSSRCSVIYLLAGDGAREMTRLG